MSALVAFFVVMHIAIYVAPWHTAPLRWLRLHWADQWFVTFCTVLLVANTFFAIAAVLTHHFGDLPQALAQGGSIAYDLYRAWREHKPPRRKLREQASDIGRKLAERMTPARVPVAVGTR